MDQELKEKKTAALENINIRLASYNNSYNALLGEIEAKLHKILNKRIPVSESQANKPSEPDCAIDSISRELMRFDLNNEKLNSLLKHLDEII